MKTNDLIINVVSTIFIGAIAFLGSLKIISYNHRLSENIDDSNFDISNNFQDFQPAVSTGSIRLYDHFVMSVPISADNIRKYSYQIQTEGKIEKATLHVEASPTGIGKDKTRIHTVYFYLDDGKTGGHLASRRENSKIVEGGFKIGDPPYVLNLDMTQLSVARGIDEKINIPALNLLNDNRKHWIGAFVATGIYGSLDNLEIEYKCQKDSQCKIGFVK